MSSIAEESFTPCHDVISIAQRRAEICEIIVILKNDFKITMGVWISEKGDVPDRVKSLTKTSARCEIRHDPCGSR